MQNIYRNQVVSVYTKNKKLKDFNGQRYSSVIATIRVNMKCYYWMTTECYYVLGTVLSTFTGSIHVLFTATTFYR